MRPAIRFFNSLVLKPRSLRVSLRNPIDFQELFPHCILQTEELTPGVVRLKISESHPDTIMEAIRNGLKGNPNVESIDMEPTYPDKRRARQCI